jgi:hypothetical protein
MGIMQLIRSTQLTQLPSGVLKAASRRVFAARREVSEWIEFVGYIVRPVDVRLTLDNGDIASVHSVSAQ